jgi:predicted Rossmann fold flavoprotein
MVAALSAARRRGSLGCERCGPVVLLERNRILGRKLAITGKGRANVTNARSIDEFVQAFGVAGRFLYPAFGSFFSDDLAALLSESGLLLKTERGGRVFPVTDKAQDVVQALVTLLARESVDVRYSARAQSVFPDPEGWTVEVESSLPVSCDAVVVATGGRSYPATGSTGDGYDLLGRVGHTISPLLPGLVTLHCAETWLRDLAGTSIEGTAVEAWNGTRLLDRRCGDVMITDRGIGGPAALSISLAVAPALADSRSVVLRVDLRPGLTLQQVLADINACATADGVLAYLSKFTPKRLAARLIAVWGLEGRGKAPLSARIRTTVARSIKGIGLTCTGTDPLTSAIVTCGGVALKEIDPRSMQSRLHPGLFIAGELLDVQAVTGGFNLQAAFSTGFTAGKCAAEYVAKSVNSDKLQGLKR